MFVKPAAGLSVPDPERRNHLPPEGDEVPDNEYWRRRIIDGDVTVTPATKPAKAKE
jgi:hypothetical protein